MDLPFFLYVTDHFQKLVASNIFNGKIDESGNDPCKKSNKTRQCPFGEYVLQHLNSGSASPIMLKQIVLIDPEFKFQTKPNSRNWRIERKKEKKKRGFVFVFISILTRNPSFQ